MGQLDEERLEAQRNAQRVAQAGRAVGGAAQLFGLKTFNWLFRPWSVVLVLLVAAAATWAAFSYFEAQDAIHLEQSMRNKAAKEFAQAVRYGDGSFDLNLSLFVADIRNGRCTYEVVRLDCVYGSYRIAAGKMVKQ